MAKKHYNRHHRVCRSNGGQNDDSNISIVDRDVHEAYHRLFHNYDVHKIAKILNDVWIGIEYEFVVQKRSE